MIYVLICLLSFTFLINVKADSIQRSLLTCASYSSCSSCYTDSTCLYISGSCYNSSTSTLRTDYYNDNTESVYCSSYSSSGYINLDNYGSNQISLYQLSSASISQHSVCQWRFYNTASNQIKIQINRSTENFEDIYMYVNYSNGDVATYSNRDLSNCNDLVYNYTLTNATYASIKVKRWSINSSYKIYVSQNSSSTNNNGSDGGAIIAIAIILPLFCLILVLIGLILLMAYKCKLPDPYSFATPEQISKIEFICATLSKMKHGKHHRFKTKFSQNSCVVCLDNFTPDSDIHITNECEHVFHSTCLRKWYCNIQCNRPLICPHCTVENTPRSRPLEFSWEFQSEPSFHVNMPHTCVLPTSIRMLDSPYDNPGD